MMSFARGHRRRALGGSPLSLAVGERGARLAVDSRSPVRWATWVALLLVEGLALSELYDSTAFLTDDRWWAILLTRAPRQVGRVVIATAVMVFLLAGRRLRDAFDHGGGGDRTRSAWPLVVAHLTAFAAFAALTVVVTRAGPGVVAFGGTWAFAWFGMGAIALGTWIGAVLPPSFVRALGRRGAVQVLIGIALAAAAVGAGQACEQFLWSPRDNSPLVRTTFWTASWLIGLFASDPVCRPELAALGTRQFTVRVSPQCSGYEGMGLILVFLGAYLAFYRKTYRFPHALLLLPLGVAAMWLANIARIALLVGVGVWISPKVAVQGFHSQAGWLAFNGIALGLVLASRRIRFFTRSDPRAEEAEYTNPTAAYLAPLLAILATTMITAAFTDGFDGFYPLRVLAAAVALWCFRRYYVVLRWTWSWTAVVIGVVTFALWMALEPTTAATATEDTLGAGLARLGPVWSTVWLVFRVVGSVVTVPLAEELAFRGYLSRRLIATDFESVPLGRFTWLSFLVSSALFGALHGRWLAGILAGMLYAFALYRRRELTDAVVAHATTNALIAGYVEATGDWSLWA